VDVGFDRRYDVYCMLFPETPTVYRNCKIVGVTGRDRRKSEDFSSASKKTTLSRGHWDPSDLLENMFVLETEDGRLAYIPPDWVKYIEETDSRRQPTEGPAGMVPRSL
jgi:hypothetical protein